MTTHSRTSGLAGRGRLQVALSRPLLSSRIRLWEGKEQPGTICRCGPSQEYGFFRVGERR